MSHKPGLSHDDIANPAEPGVNQEIVSNVPETQVQLEKNEVVKTVNPDTLNNPPATPKNILNETIKPQKSVPTEIGSTGETIESNFIKPIDLSSGTTTERFSNLLEMKNNITEETLHPAKDIFIDYARDNSTFMTLAGLDDTKRVSKLFGQFFTQSKETLKEYLQESQTETGLKNALNMYIGLMNNSEIPTHFESWLPVMNQETNEVFNILKHGKIGGVVEFWLDSDGDGLADKIFNTEEEVKSFLQLKD